MRNLEYGARSAKRYAHSQCRDLPLQMRQIPKVRPNGYEQLKPKQIFSLCEEINGR
jgi:hypothetical protein